MDESFQEKRKRELGLSGGSDSSQGGSPSFQEARKMDLGLIPDTRQKPSAPPMNDLVSQGKLPSMNVSNSPLMQQANQFQQPEVEDNRNAIQRGLDYAFKENPVSRVLNYPFAKAAELSVPNAPFIGEPGTNARQAFAEKNPVLSTGSNTLDKVGDFIAPAISFFTPVGAPGQNLANSSFGAAEKLAATKIGQKAGQKLGELGAAAANKINPILNTQGINVSTNLANKAGQAFGKGATAGALYGAQEPFAFGSGQVSDVPESVVQNALLFGGVEAGLPFVGAGLKAAGEKIGSAYQAAADKAPSLGFTPFNKTGEQFTNALDTRSHIVSKTGSDPLNVPETLNKFYEKSVDNIQRINQFDKYVEQQTGKTLSPSERSYYLALNSRGADMTSNHILTERLVDSQGNAIGQSLKDVTKQIPKRNVIDFEDYLIAKHAETRMARGETVYNKKADMTPEKVALKVAEYEQKFPEFKKISDELYDFNNNLGKAWLVDTGIISPETWSAWREANPNWVPNKRKFDDIEKPGFMGTKKGFGGQSNPVKGYSETGSERPIISPLESMIEYADQFVKTAKRNEVMQSIIKNIEKDPEGFKDFAEIVKQPEKPTDIGKLLSEENGLDEILARFNDEFDKAMRKQDLTKGNIVSGLINGERVHVKVNDAPLLEALTNLTPQGRSTVLDMTRKVTNTMKLLTTGINPVFSLTRNIFYDLPQAYAFSKTTNNPVRFAWDLLDGVVSTIGNKELYQSYKAMGGGHSSSVAADRNLLAQSKLSILPQKSKSNILRKAYAGLENLSNVIESAPRLGEFKRVTQKDGGSYDSKVKGLYEANDLTTNFKKFGNVTREADALFPYLNAAVQGLDKNIRAFKDNPVQVGAKAFGAVTIPTLALYALNYNNPEYQKLSNYVKDRFFLFPTTDGKFVKIPKPRELGVPFGAAIERALRHWNEKDPEAFKDFAQAVTIAFAPPGVGSLIEGKNPLRDTIGGPLIDVTANENFAGAPIVPGYLKGLSPRLQYDTNTSEVSKKAGDLLNISPMQIDHLIKSYGGVIGQVGLPAATKGTTLGEVAAKQVTADPVFSTDATKNFYDLKTKLDTQYKDANHTGVIPEGYSNEARKFMDQTANKLSDISKQIRQIDSSDLPSAEKKQRKKELTDLRNEVARDAYKNVKDITKGSR